MPARVSWASFKRPFVRWLLLLLFVLFSLYLLQQPMTFSAKLSQPVLLTVAEEPVQEEDPNLSCLEFAQQHPEPYTEHYRNQQIDLEGPMYALFNWNEDILPSHLESQKTLSQSQDCRMVLKVKFE